MEAAARTIRNDFRGWFPAFCLGDRRCFDPLWLPTRTGSKLLAGCQAHLIVELDGQENSVRMELGKLEKLIKAGKPNFVQRALAARSAKSSGNSAGNFPMRCATPV